MMAREPAGGVLHVHDDYVALLERELAGLRRLIIVQRLCLQLRWLRFVSEDGVEGLEMELGTRDIGN
jgi:hypothetical protein